VVALITFPLRLLIVPSSAQGYGAPFNNIVAPGEKVIVGCATLKQSL
jgi:hypothetical protein